MGRFRRFCRRCRLCIMVSLALGYMIAYLVLEGNSSAILPDVTPYTDKPESRHADPGGPSEAMSPHELYLSEIQQKASSIARVYQPSHPSTWCVDARLKLNQKPNRPMGLCYVPIPHSAGTTLKGINMRISYTFPQRHGQEEGMERCIRHDSKTAGVQYTKRDELSYLWTFLRDPTARALSVAGSRLSQVFLNANSRDSFNATMPAVKSPFNSSATINNILVNRTLGMLQHSKDVNKGILSEGRGGFQLQYCMQHYMEANGNIKLSNRTEIVNHSRLLKFVWTTFQRYDFVGIVERFDESLVVMQLLLGLETSDMLYFAAKRKEDWQRARLPRRDFICRKPFDWEKDLITEAPIRSYVTESKEWQTQNYGDYLFYQAANLSLDQTIMKIGSDVFASELKKFRALLKRAHGECTPKFPCSSDGKNQSNETLLDCIDGYACGYRCFDDLVRRIK